MAGNPCPTVQSAFHQATRLLRIGLRSAQFLQVGAGYEHARFAAAQNQPLQLLATRQFPKNRLELPLHGLAQGIGPAAGLIEGQDADAVGPHFQRKGGRELAHVREVSIEKRKTGAAADAGVPVIVVSSDKLEEWHSAPLLVLEDAMSHGLAAL